MNVSKVITKNIPEMVLLLSTLFYMFASVGFVLNPIAVVVFIAIVAQMYFKNRITGVVLSSIFMLIFAYLFLALFSDLAKLESLVDGWEMLVFGTFYIGASLVAAIYMLLKYIRTVPTSEKLVQ